MIRFTTRGLKALLVLAIALIVVVVLLLLLGPAGEIVTLVAADGGGGLACCTITLGCAVEEILGRPPAISPKGVAVRFDG